MNLRQLLYFKTVVEQGSLAAASEVLHIAQPPLSVSIKQLEALWGVSLFERTGRGLLVTDTGLALYERACQLLNNASEIEDAMTSLGRGFSGRVRIGFVTAGIEPVARTVATLRAELPSVTFSLHQGEPRLLEDMIERRAIDFALTHLPVANSALAVRTLTQLEFAALYRRDDHEFVEDADLSFASLSGKPLVVLRRSSGPGFYERILQEFRTIGADSNIVADSSDVPAIVALVQHGVGVGVLPVWSFESFPGSLTARKIVSQSGSESFALVHGMGRRFLPAVQRAISVCTSIF
ncbi:LysR family transcriptional regulator [Paraburkholderia domus]|uniref:LysR family transcriptional regulator n=1 Tax=Paraburkholderia domus TaxID=2793075 RepID=UPI001911D12D|nr:LysR family transcriptional regulator [Paraburkholderia domus]MBK5052288.1 LysR family transcriptional regulator [Burkholderia sp. R-70006]MBK5182123.1 LysR family transcriptional regulator [Burkholderia sp. R-69749]MCI0151263.1 LysR family transcriptional regulator [Paraburkholderia sediminicola]CAE6806171.1 HTH-type transcriptional regulator CatM [Paraburkholderia domus]CAE6841263.1 HTH-type transcriptional regulator CatM [Paraburkholderia domus]